MYRKTECVWVSCLPQHVYNRYLLFSFSNFIHTFSVFISFQTEISDIDILDILNSVPIPNLGDLYSRLHLKETHVTNAKLGASTPREAEKKVLCRWRNINDKAATRDAILEAMGKDITWKEWENILRKKWGYPPV